MEWYFILLIALSGAMLVWLLLWLFLVGSKNGAALGELRQVKYAHRGLHGELDYGSFAAENSLTAFDRAASRGYGIELDVRLSADGVVTVFHDDTLERVCGVPGKVCELTSEELSKIHLKGTDDVVPTFREVLDTVGGRVPLLVELKGESGDVEIARRAVAMLKEYSGEYIIESFNPLLLAEVKRLDANIPRGFLVSRHTANKNRRTLKYRIIQRHFLNFLARPHFIASDKKHMGLFPIKLLCRLFGTALLAWTVRTKEEENECRKEGAQGVIFENYLA